jgi:K+:H+ antiporter
MNDPALPQGAPAWRLALVYGLMLAAAAGLFLVIRSWGETLPVPPPDAAAPRTTAGPVRAVDPLFHVLLALAAIIITCRVVGRLFVLMRQPPVIGEVVAGILLGPSFLGRIAPEIADFLLPASVAPFLSVIAQLGVVLYMFLVGLELNAELLHSRAQATLAISHASIVVPFVLGSALSLGLYATLAAGGVPFTSFALFMGVAMSITAFPVLARILTDHRMAKTELGVIALSCAATDDVTAWCLLAFVIGVAQAEAGGAVLVACLTMMFMAIVFFIVRPLAARLVAHYEKTGLTSNGVAIVFAALLLAALTTEAIGIHAIFGAFLLGAVIPQNSVVARAFPRKLEDVVTILLLPAFFAYTGLRTQIGLVAGVEDWLICGAIIMTATLGKFGGTLIAARLTGLNWQMCASLGILMNTRGLMELIVLNIGLDLGVISPTLFAMMVLMALATTLATTPILRVLNPEMGAEARADMGERVEI